MAIGHHCCYLLLLCLSCFLFSFSNANDTAIMLKLSASISPTPPSWKTNNNNNFCNWEGISCDNSNRVTNISLSNKSLDGTLPSDLNNLSQLKILDLSYNSLSGAIPTLANLAFLEEVSLLNNNFTSIPFNFFLGLTNLQRFSISFNFYLAPWILPYDLIQCTNLRTFSARQVNLIGSIPDIFNNLTNLEVLRLSNNRLNGTLPSSLNNLSHLKMLELDKNSLSGTPTLANLTLLETVHLGTNKFTSIPFDFFLGLTNLQVFGMSYNLYLAPWILPANSLIQCSNLREFSAHQVNLTSSIPDIFNNLPYLEILGLSRNRLNGTLPSSLNNLSHLKYLYLEINSLSGALPTLANLALLETVYLDNNNFSSIPFNFFQGLTNLKTFKISNNSDLQQWNLPYDLIQCTKLVLFQAINANIISSIPDIFNSLLSLQDLRLAYNNLTGKLPATFGRSNITHLFLDNQLQGLSGTLYAISEMTQLRKLWLQANAFTGAIPDLSKCTNLEDLQLSDNQLTGLVSDSLIYHSGFALVTLENNRLQGPLPVFARDVESLLDNNSFCLPTPGKCDPQVTALLEVAGALGYPMSLAKSWKGNDACGGWNFVTCDSSGKNVTIVNFGKQKFLGTISPSFANLTSLRNLSMNENNLTGSIPEVLKSLPHLQFLDVSNNNLSGPVPEFPQNVTFLHTNNPFLGKHSNRQSASIGMVIGVVISALIFVGIIVAFVSYKCYRFPRKLHIQTTRDLGEIPISEGVNVTISIQLLEKVTDSFSDDNVLGRGGFGIVYKGELHDGTKIAVKRMQSDVKGTQGIKEFHAEIEVLTKVRHRHLVALLGFCISGNERLLVYEYMPQGALSQHLFKWRENKSLPLSWKQRVSIALDVGRGVEYLHRLAQQSFIHRDLKPANILLDDHMRAKVCDFGLVKNAPDGKYSIETRLAGTFGYLAPEYAATGRVTTKVDVYAFGVVLMQLITGRKALDGTMSDERYPLVTWFRKVPVCKENMIRFRDQVLDTDDCETLESILEVAELARHCTASQPFQRPDMGYVVSVLCHLVEKWKPSQHGEEKTYSHQHHRSLPELLDDDDTSRMLNVFRLNSF